MMSTATAPGGTTTSRGANQLVLQANDLVKSKYRDRRAASPTDYIQTNNSKKDRDYASYKNQ